MFYPTCNKVEQNKKFDREYIHNWEDLQFDSQNLNPWQADGSLRGSTPTLKQPLLTKQLEDRVINKDMFIAEKMYTNNNL